jgi:hypothetical protein
MTAEMLADPISVVVRLVTRIEPQLGPAVIEEAVASAAGGRARRRKLAQALHDRHRSALRRGCTLPAVQGGAAYRNRTDDLFITSESLCRLS